MEYRMLGKTNQKISAISLGAEHLEGKPRELVMEVISAAIDHGMNYIDLLMPQSDLRSYIGEALKGRRDKVMVAGHIGAVLTEDGQYMRTRDEALSLRFIEDFLRRVGGECIDMLMLHYVDEDSDATIVLETLLNLALKLQKEGKARFIGLSSHIPSVARRIVETGKLDAVLFPVNPLADALGNDDMFEDSSYANLTMGRSKEREAFRAACLTHGTAIISMKTYAAGRILTENSALGIALTPAQCIHYTLSQPAVVSAAIGCISAQEVATAAAYFTATPQERDYSVLRGAAAYRDQPPLCMYCNHCLPCPVNIDIAATTRILDAAMYDGVNDSLRKAYSGLTVTPDACIECGSCNANCPFGVDAQHNMRRAHSMFDMGSDG